MTLDVLIDEYERALSYTESLWRDLGADEVRWRPVPASSAIGWHLGHQAAVAHFMIRNLTASEPSPDPSIDPVMDSSFPEERRDEIPDIERLDAYRTAVIERVRARMHAIREGRAGAPEQMAIVATTVLTALVNHEYQHDTWIAEVRRDGLGRTVPPAPVSPNLVVVDGYPVLRTR